MDTLSKYILAIKFYILILKIYPLAPNLTMVGGRNYFRTGFQELNGTWGAKIYSAIIIHKYNIIRERRDNDSKNLSILNISSYSNLNLF